MTRLKRSIPLSIGEVEQAQLKQLALDFGQTNGDRPRHGSSIVARMDNRP